MRLVTSHGQTQTPDTLPLRPVPPAGRRGERAPEVVWGLKVFEAVVVIGAPVVLFTL